MCATSNNEWKTTCDYSMGGGGGGGGGGMYRNNERKCINVE